MMRRDLLANPQERGISKAMLWVDRVQQARRDGRETGRRKGASFPPATENMAPQYMTRAVYPCGRGYVALSALVAGLAILTSLGLAFGKPSQGLDLVDDLTKDTIQTMRMLMVRYRGWGRDYLWCAWRKSDWRRRVL